MNQAVDIEMLTPQPNSWHMIRALGGIGVLCALLIVLTFQATLPVITRNKAEALERAIFKVLPGATKRTTFEIMDGQLRPVAADAVPAPGTERVYVGYDADGALVGVAIEAAGQGFQDVIRLLYGYAPQRQQVIGMEVLESKETPGLGDKIIKDANFVANFAALDVTLAADGKGLAHAVEAVKNGKKVQPWQIDGITGATISSVAVAKIIHTSTSRVVPILMPQLVRLERGDG